MKKQYTFDFVNTEEEAQKKCEAINTRQSYYMRKKHPAHYTPWTSKDGSEHLFVVFYYI